MVQCCGVRTNNHNPSVRKLKAVQCANTDCTVRVGGYCSDAYDRTYRVHNDCFGRGSFPYETVFAVLQQADHAQACTLLLVARLRCDERVDSDKAPLVIARGATAAGMVEGHLHGNRELNRVDDYGQQSLDSTDHKRPLFR